MHLQVEFLRENLIAMGAVELGHTVMDHLFVFVQVSFLGKLHVALVTFVGPLPSVGP